MKPISKRKLKTYLLLIFLGISIYGATLDVLLSSSNFREGLDLYNYEKVYADSTNSGFNFFTNYIDVSLGVTGSYQTVDTSGSVPSGATGVLLEIYSIDGLANQGVYQRHPDSADDFYTAGVGLQNQGFKYAIVPVNPDREYEMKIGDLDVNTKLLGYTDSYVTLFESVIDVSQTTTGSWEDVDLSANVPSGATGVIILAETSANPYKFGMRHPASTDTIFYNDVHGWVYGLCGVNSSRYYQVKIENVAVKQYLVGYTTAPITFFTNWIDYSTANTGVWDDMDFTGDVGSDATGVLIVRDPTGAGWLKGDVREEGSTNDVQAYTQMITDGIHWYFVGVDNDEVAEQKIGSASVDHWLVGYMEELLPPTVIYPDSIDGSFHTTNATHSLMDNGTFAILEKDGWIVWDFAGGQAYNITAIRWELVHPVSHPWFRLSGSTDKLSWTPICQMTSSEVTSPPSSDLNTSTRYDTLYYPNFRYYMIQAIGGVLSDYYIDYICLIPAPPYISYNSSGYLYPTEVEYYNYGVKSFNYRWKPYNMLGLNRTTGTTGNNSVINHLVNIDDDADNWAVLKFVDYFNITSIEIYADVGTASQHTYMYVSRYPSSGWVLVWDKVGDNSFEWMGVSTNQSYVRYVKINCTGIMSSITDILGVRIQGVYASAGDGPPPANGNGDGFSFILLPDYIGDLLGLGLDGGRFFASLIILSAFLLPIAVYDRKGIIALIVGVAVFGFLVLIEWLPQWIMLIMVMFVAGIFAFNFSRWFGGRGK